MIKVDAIVGGKPHAFKFLAVTPEKIAEWAAKMKARQSRVEILDKRIKIMEKEPIEKQDDNVLLDLQDRHAVAFTKLLEFSEGMLGWVAEPGKDEVIKLISEHPKDMQKVFDELFNQIVPSEDDQKKS